MSNPKNYPIIWEKTQLDSSKTFEISYLAIDADGTEWVFDSIPQRWYDGGWYLKSSKENGVSLPKGSIKALIGRELSWNDEPVKLKEIKGQKI